MASFPFSSISGAFIELMTSFAHSAALGVMALIALSNFSSSEIISQLTIATI
jgi:hypothetical protein